MKRLLVVALLLLACAPFGAQAQRPRRYARWDWFDAAALPYLQQAGITHLMATGQPPGEFRAACEKAGIEVLPDGSAPAGFQVIEVKWPGLDPMVQTRGGAEVVTTGATGDPWIDSNGWLILSRRSLDDRPAVVSCDPPKNSRLRPGSVELAVADAAIFGAQFAVKLDGRFRQGLAAAQPRAVAEWKRVVRQLEFSETAPFRGAPAANIAVVAEASGAQKPADETGEALNLPADETGEALNLLARRNLPFVVLPRKQATPAMLQKYALVIAIAQPPLSVKGPILVERKEAPDPSALATEVRQLLGDRRLYHLTNAETIISYPRRLDGGRLALHLVNYAIDPVRDVRVRMFGTYTRAQLLAPELDKAQELPVKEGELAIPEVRISAVLILE